ncbi:PREDICTED: acyl-coenzyme A oxidase 3, peroxisomal-like [Populus euphratica]|uniref:Acyl-coenzyme A oxidase n=1 Tax=Populus euphratica TaxID=75702 RepID=A0AAJ6XCP5_POPEU|nr:PREDICTED: acyl-coenzyme A oxidase 3, peroxisomal-like [Populus euphratica]
MAQESSINTASRRTRILHNHLVQSHSKPTSCLQSNSCLSYSPPELAESFDFDVKEMRKILDFHNLEDRDWLFGVIKQGSVFNGKERGGRLFVSPDYNQTMEQQREMTMKRIEYLLERGAFDGWLTKKGVQAELKKLAFLEVIQIFDHSLSVKIGVHFFLWGGAIQFMGTKRHHDKWLRDTETFAIKGCFSMTELGHGSNVRGIETVTTYDSKTGEFVINTPCESAQKYWIGGAANHATHTIVFSQLNINGVNEGVHALIAQIRDVNGNICPNIRIADCGHKIGLNGVDNGRIWFDNVRIPRENLLNSVADVSPDGQYLSSIKDQDQRFAAFLAPLTFGRVTIATSAIYSAKIGLAIAIRYALSRRAFSITPNGPEVLLLDYPSHQRRLLPLLAKSYAMSFGGNYLKMMYVNRTPESAKTLHVVSSAFKAIFTWHNMRTLQECRVSKALLSEYVAAKKKNKPFKGLGLEHMNGPVPVIQSNLTSTTLRNSQFQMNVHCLRERDLLNRFAAEASLYQSKGESKERAFILSYQLAEDLGRAFSDRAILQTFIDAEANVSASPLKNVLGLLRSMYALICLEEDAAFLRYGYLSTDNAAAVRNEVTKLCGELRPHALALVSSLGIPDAFLSPIAFNWIDANSWSSVQK